jgi:ABC-2 type transport system permease protein
MVLAVLMVSVEYRYKTIGTTFMVTPKRSVVLLAKMAIAVAIALVIGLVAIVASALAFGALGGRAVEAFHPASGLAFHMYATVPVVAMVSAAIAVAVASLTRNSVVAVALVVAWPSILEPLLSALPGIGSSIAPGLPFVNARNFIGLEGADLSWSWQASGAYFLAVALALVALALVHQNRQDVPVT